MKGPDQRFIVGERLLEETVKVKIEFVELLQLGDLGSIIYCGYGRMVLCGRVFILSAPV